MEDQPTICGRLRSATILLALSPHTLSLSPYDVAWGKMTSRFRRLPDVTRGQAPRPALVEDRSSYGHHNHRIRSSKTVRTFCCGDLFTAISSRRSFHGDLFTAIFSRRSYHGDLFTAIFSRRSDPGPAGQTGAWAPRISENKNIYSVGTCVV